MQYMNPDQGGGGESYKTDVLSSWGNSNMDSILDIVELILIHGVNFLTHDNDIVIQENVFILRRYIQECHDVCNLLSNASAKTEREKKQMWQHF